MVVVKEDRSWLPHIKTRNRSWGCALLAKHLPSVASGPVSEPQHCQNLKITPMHETTAKRTSVHCHRRVCVAAGLTAVGGRCVEQGSLQTDTEIPASLLAPLFGSEVLQPAPSIPQHPSGKSWLHGNMGAMCQQDGSQQHRRCVPRARPFGRALWTSFVHLPDCL